MKLDERNTVESDVAESLRSSLRKLAVLTLVMGTALLIIHTTPLKSLLSDVHAWKSQLAGAGVLAPVVFFLLSALLVAVGIPRLFLCGVAGALFGFLSGSFLSLGSAVCGSYGTFLFARWAGRKWLQRKVHLSPRVRAMLDRPNWLSVVILRQMPVVGLIQNAALGLTRIRHRGFLIGTLVGILPSTFLVALISSGAGKTSLKGYLPALTSAMILMGLLAAAVYRWMRTRRA